MAILHRALFTWFIVLVFFILLVLRLDEKVTWNWFLIFSPMWLFDSVVTIFITFKMIVHCKNGYERLTMKRKIYYMFSVFLKLSFQVLLCMRLEYYSIIDLHYVMIPLWILMLETVIDVSTVIWRKFIDK